VTKGKRQRVQRAAPVLGRESDQHRLRLADHEPHVRSAPPPPPRPPDIRAAPVFARPVTGLRREFGLWDTFVFNTLGYAPGLVLAITPFFAGGIFPGRSVLVVLSIGTALTLFNGLMYGGLAGAMPRSGGEYIYNGRVLHPAVGFVTNWGFTWSQLLGLAIYTQWSVSHALAVALSTTAYSMRSARLLHAAAWVERPVATFLVATGFLRWLLGIGFVLAMAGFVVTLVVLLGHSHSSFVGVINDFLARTRGMKDGYSGLISEAQGMGWHAGAASWSQYFIALPLAYWMFMGFTYSVYIGGEVRDPERTQRRAILGSLFVGYALYMVALAAYYRIVGGEFNNAAAYLELHGHSPLPVAGVVNFFAGLLTSNMAVNILIGGSFFLWHYLLLFVIFTVVVRNIFAWGFDQVLPRGLTAVTRRTGTPWVATVVAGVSVESLLALLCFTSLFTYVYNYIVLFSIAFLITSFSAMLLPYRRPDLARKDYPLVSRRVLGIPLLSLSGVLNLILFSMILFAAFRLPGFSGPTGPSAVAFVAGIYLSAVVLYLAMRLYRGRSGVDLSLLYEQIPPE
jgi:APA family basic amino acid/polyamine antiporter